jgi:uncharacterized protein YbjT (DUF2867 family)
VSVLILGSTGRVGPHVASALVARDVVVRALVRDPRRSAATLPAAVEVVGGDFDDGASVRSALDGMDALLLLTPHGPHMTATQIRVVGLARRAGTRVVKLSGTSSAIRPDGPDGCRQHWAVEQELARAQSGYVILRPNAFIQTLLAGKAATVQANGTITNPLGTAGISLVDCADIGHPAAEVLVDSHHDGNTYALTGPAAPTFRDIAGVIAAVTGREVSVVDVSPEQAAQAARDRGGSAWEVEHLGDMLAHFRAGHSDSVTDDMKRLTGHEPRSVADYVHDRQDDFIPGIPRRTAFRARSSPQREELRGCAS